MGGPTSTSACHCKVLHHADGWFVYDRGSGALLEVDAILADVIAVEGNLQPEGVAARLRGRHEEPLINQALAELEGARRSEGLFRAIRLIEGTARPRHWNPLLYEDRIEHLTLSVSEQCNLRCRYCLHTLAPAGVRPHRDAAMSEATFLRAIEFYAARCAQARRPTVSLYGGEPLLQKRLLRLLVDMIDGHPQWPRMQIMIDTNATLIDEELATISALHELQWQVSLDGPLAQHDRHRVDASGAGSFLRVRDGLRRLIRGDPGVMRRLSFVVTVAPPSDLAATSEFFADLQNGLGLALPLNCHVTVSFADVRGAPELSEGPALEQLRADVTAARAAYVAGCAAGRHDALSPVLRGLFDKELIALHHRARGPLPGERPFLGCCQPGLRRLHVRADGALQPCERVAESIVIGNVVGGFDLPAIERLCDHFGAAVGERCNDCWAARMCDLCFTALGPGMELPTSLCDAVRTRKEHAIRLYLDLLAAGGGPAVAWLADTVIA